MSRKYLNGKWCVRCGKKTPTPYLEKNWELLGHEKGTIVDIGCGNGRNTVFMQNKGFACTPLDMADDFGNTISLGKEKFPLDGKSIDIFLANYVLMFLSKKERNQVASEIKRTAKDGSTIMVELYPALDSNAPSEEKMVKLQKEFFDKLGCTKIRYSKGKFIARIGE
jgi:hypothetical protein